MRKIEKSILIVTHQRGFEADPVIDELRRRNVKVFRFNTDAGKNPSLTSFTSRKEEIRFSCDGRSVSGSEIGAAWCQQLPPYLRQSSGENECLQRESLWNLQYSALELLSVKWLNKPSNVLYASKKVNQIALAKQVLLPLPDTLVSNNPNTIREFAKGRTIVAKNLATPWIISSDVTRAAYTRIVDSEWLADDAALSFAPVIYQKYYERKKDFRVVIIDDKHFAASCIPKAYQQEDIRRKSKTGESFKPCSFNANILKKLHHLMSLLSINYCAADFMEDKKGNLFFLEINTCGAWWWLDRFYNGAICQNLADALMYRAGYL